MTTAWLLAITLQAVISPDTLPGSCVAVPPTYGPAVWESPGGKFTAQSDFSSDRLRQLLSGRLLLVAVASEGYGTEKQLLVWDLVLRPDSLTEPPRLGGPPRGLLLSGEGTPLVDGPARKPRQVRKPTSMPFRVVIRDSTSITLEHAPFDTYDGNGRSFSLRRVDLFGRWLGRWGGGGFEVHPLSTPYASIAEQESGYFCAIPQRRRSCGLTSICS